MKIKSAPLKVKAAGEADGLEEGQFIAYASVFGGPPDSYGDIVDPGAFAASLKSWEEKGDPIPLLWGHDFVDPFSNIGHVVKAEEDDHGLLPWCFGEIGRTVEPFSDLRLQQPDTWMACEAAFR